MTLNQIILAVRKRVLLATRGRYFVVQRGGTRYLVDILNHIDRHIEQYGAYEKPLLNRFLNELRSFQPALFLDIGANLGVYSLAVAQQFESMDIISFEPDSRNRSQLHANLFLNDLQDRVRVQDVALSDEDGHAAFRRHAEENRGRSCIAEEGAGTVTKRRLDGLIEVRDARIAVKIDVEGHEMHVLKGMSRIVSVNDCLIQVEAFESRAMVEDFMRSHGYSLAYRDDGNFVFCRANSLEGRSNSTNYGAKVGLHNSPTGA